MPRDRGGDLRCGPHVQVAARPGKSAFRPLAETQLLLLAPELLNPETLAGLKEIENLARKMRQILHDLDR